MEVVSAIIVVLMTIAHATMAIVRLIVTWVNGVLGARAQRLVMTAINTALAISGLPHVMEVAIAITLLIADHATMAIVQFLVIMATGLAGHSALVHVGPAIRLALVR